MTLPALWLGMVGGPIVWLLYLQVSYILAPRACRAGDKTALAVVAVVALVATIAVTIVAWRAWRATEADYSAGEGTVLGRSRFMALSGLGISALIILLVIASFIPIVVYGACD